MEKQKFVIFCFSMCTRYAAPRAAQERDRRAIARAAARTPCLPTRLLLLFIVVGDDHLLLDRGRGRSGGRR